MDNDKLTQMRNKFQSAINEKTNTNLARQCGFTQRLRTITPYDLGVSLIAAIATQKVETLADIVRLFNAFTYKTSLINHSKPFHNQLSKQQFAELMLQHFCYLLDRLLIQVLKPIPRSVLRIFPDILIQDGSCFAIKDTLKDVFPGRFTKISPAAVEIHATMSVFHDQVVSVALAADTQGERDFLPSTEQLKGLLPLADCGYQNAHYCESLKKCGGLFVIRHQSRINPVVLDSYRGQRRVRKDSNKRLQQLVNKYRKERGRFYIVALSFLECNYAGPSPSSFRFPSFRFTIFIARASRNRCSDLSLADLYLRYRSKIRFRSMVFGRQKPPFSLGLIILQDEL